jgi:hypothetical protein
MKNDEQLFLVAQPVIKENSLSIPVTEYKGLRDSIYELLLPFFDEVTFQDADWKSSNILFLGINIAPAVYKKTQEILYKAINAFYVPEWLEYFRAGTIAAEFQKRLSLMNYQRKYA